ncbi:ASCH domain-containing protein [Cohnella herbarum]|uniref:ASCH domain-containing protein n=1 Tax=Cohnella herbarum TaxID=2728023 RepID=A0A7Z2ZMW3_9BACL|nr:ASCH domain-containing protein [Cohnella herbarum]QJD85429.1 ASCH domain-containing protein [Cohnella herbarum]
MLFRDPILEGIRTGSIDVAFRLWNKPRVHAGTQLRTPIGVVEIMAIEAVSEGDIADEEIARAGYASRQEMRKELGKFGGTTMYRIALRYAGSDPRETLREQDELTDSELAELRNKLEKMDKLSRRGPWTFEMLWIIGKYPGLRATELADHIGWEPDKFKIYVRKLKELGLTISLGTGYKISPRGEIAMKRYRNEDMC